jgi:hypothetical protein
MRAELMTKARQGAPSWFGLTDLELGEDVVSSCQWLLQENHFLYGGIDLKVSDISQFSTTADSRMLRRGLTIAPSPG